MRYALAGLLPRGRPPRVVLRAVAALVLVGSTAAVAADRMPALQLAQAAGKAAMPTAPVAARFTVASTRPRILLNDGATRERLKRLSAGNDAAANRFVQLVNSAMAGRNVYAFQPWFAALLYQLDGDPAYGRFAIERTDAWVASEEALIGQNQRARVAGDSYLEIGGTIGNLALVYDWCHDLLTPAQKSRWITYANQAVANIWNHRQARWGSSVYPWSGWSVDNPANNYYYSFLRATMLLGMATQGENPQAAGWIEMFRITKLERELFPTFNRDLEGGGSREGTGYGTALKNLFQLYDWWEKSTGERIALRTPHTRASIAHFMHSVVPTLDALAPTGDHARDSTAALFDYHREYLLTLMSLFPADRLSGAAKSLLAASTVRQMNQGFNFYVDFLYEQPDLAAVPLTSLATAYWGPGTGQFSMRSDWSRDATYANFICGPYSESHAHRDQGSFVIFKGNWLAYDQNIASRSGIEQGEELHNLVRIEQDGAVVKQSYGTSCLMQALADTPRFAFASARVTPSYRGKAMVTRIEREFLFVKPDTFVVFDRVATGGSARRIWTLNLPGTAEVEADRISSANGRGRLDVFQVAPTGAPAQVSAWPALKPGMRGGTRVDVTDTSGAALSLFLNVLSAGGAVSRVERTDQPGQTGVLIHFADGRKATVRFSGGSAVGTLDLRAADGSVQFNGSLPSAVMPPPLFVEAN